MSLSLKEISDRIEIKDLLIDYCHAVDSNNIDQFDNIFTKDARIDYSAFESVSGDVNEVKAYFIQSLPKFIFKQHMISNCRIRLKGDKAEARTMCFNPLSLPDSDAQQLNLYGFWYVDKLVRTTDGWRISERIMEKSYAFQTLGRFL